MGSAWGKSWGFAFGNSWGLVDTAVIQPEEPIVQPGDDGHATRIQQQNRTLISLLIGFAAQGAFE